MVWACGTRNNVDSRSQIDKSPLRHGATLSRRLHACLLRHVLACSMCVCRGVALVGRRLASVAIAILSSSSAVDASSVTALFLFVTALLLVVTARGVCWSIDIEGSLVGVYVPCTCNSLS